MTGGKRPQVAKQEAEGKEMTGETMEKRQRTD
jgi:hypothetical protein